MSPLLTQLSTQVSRAASQAKGGSSNEALESLLQSLSFLKNLFLSVLIMVLFYFLGRLIANRIVRRLQEARGESLYPDMESLVYRFSVLGSLFVGFSVVLQFIFGVDFLQVVGFFGLGISLAFKDMLSNVIAGAVIIIQNRIRINDFIQVGKIKGKVMEIQSRVTILKSVDNAEIIIPNSVVMNSNVINYSYHPFRRISFPMILRLHEDLEQAKKTILEVIKNKEHVLKKPTPMILTNITSGHYHLKVFFFIDPQDKKKSWLMTRSELVAEVKAALEKAGFTIPFPTYVYLESDRGSTTERSLSEGPETTAKS